MVVIAKAVNDFIYLTLDTGYGNIWWNYSALHEDGAGQFFRWDYHIKKSSAHRKAVLQRKEKAKERRMKVHLHQIEQDRSPGKKSSHARLTALVHDSTHKGLMRLYMKKELQRLSSMYDVKYLSRWNKEKLAGELSNVIPRSENMPNQYKMSNYAAEIVQQEEPTRILMRFRRA